MTAVWEVVNTGTAPNLGGHADGLRFGQACSDPFADFNGDGSVDQAEFAFFQACYTGGGVRSPRRASVPTTSWITWSTKPT
jgi:hypothetical protein